MFGVDEMSEIDALLTFVIFSLIFFVCVICYLVGKIDDLEIENAKLRISNTYHSKNSYERR